jgi:hypothetical protein
MGTITRFEFLPKADAGAVEADIALAILCGECIYGRPRVRMEVSYVVDPGGKAAVVETGGEAGDAVARVFAGLLSVHLGEQAYRVRRLPSAADTAEVGS